jgi:hypothetical protein
VLVCQDHRVPQLHNNAPKRVTTQSAAVAETKWSWVFTRSTGAWEVTTAAPSRGSRHPQASSPLALKRWTFARNHLRHTTVPWSVHRHQNGPPEHDLGAATVETLPAPGSPAAHSCRPHDQRDKPSPSQRRSPKSRPRDPPSGAAAPASTSSHQQDGRFNYNMLT